MEQTVVEKMKDLNLTNPESNNSNNEEEETETSTSMKKSKIVVIMGPTGSGKSKLAIDLATHFPIEIINADSMQVYTGLDVLTNKVTLSEQKGVAHHLLGTISPDVEFTSKDFRDAAVPLIREIISRDHLPVIVGGTNFYIQALVSPFLLDDSVDGMDNSCLSYSSDIPTNSKELGCDSAEEGENYSYDRLKALDPVAADRLHPNDQRKIRHYLELFANFGVLPSKLFREKMTENWGRLGGDSRYDCCFICVDASLPVLDQFVEQRVDRMIEAGLLDEVHDIYTLNGDYTRGLRQAIGVREFEDFFHLICSEAGEERMTPSPFMESASLTSTRDQIKQRMWEPLNCSDDTPNRRRVYEGIDNLKLNTRRLVRRQKRRIKRLETLFGWYVHYVDSTESLLGGSEDTWIPQVVTPAAKIISCFLGSNPVSVPVSMEGVQKPDERDLWTRYICEACENKVLRGAHEWEQHRQGRGHRKRLTSLRKRRALNSAGTHLPGGLPTHNSAAYN